MFGKNESITDQSCAPWYFVDYQEQLSKDDKVRWSNRIYPDGTWEANIYQFFYKVYNQLSQTLPIPFKLDGITRIEETSAHIAVREALVNTLVHCSYAEQGNIVIIREPNKITMRNPGRMLISVEDFYAGSQSLCRNPILQKMFMFLGYGEKAGSGADTIVKGWQDNKWGRPVIQEKVQPDTVTLILTIDHSVNNPQNVPRQSQDVPSSSQDVPRQNLVRLKLSQACPKLAQRYIGKATIALTAMLEHDKSLTKLMEIVGEKIEVD